MNNYFKEKYIPQINKWGRIIGWIAVLVIFLPATGMAIFHGITPDKGPLGTALTAWIIMNAVWWVIEPVSYFPILGIPGTYLAFLSGNISNLRLPSAAASQKAAGVEPGTNEGYVISTLGMSASVLVNLIMLFLASVIGQAAISSLPEEFTTALTYLLPALFGAVFAQFAIDDIFSAVVGLGLSIGVLLMYNAGWLNWIPLDPSIATILIPIFGTIFAAKYYYSRKKAKQEEKPVESSEP
jgi:hypothetical protein